MAIHQCGLYTRAQTLKKMWDCQHISKTRGFQAQVFCFITNMGHQVEDIPHKLGIEDVSVCHFSITNIKTIFTTATSVTNPHKVLSGYCYSKSQTLHCSLNFKYNKFRMFK